MSMFDASMSSLASASDKGPLVCECAYYCSHRDVPQCNVQPPACAYVNRDVRFYPSVDTRVVSSIGALFSSALTRTCSGFLPGLLLYARERLLYYLDCLELLALQPSLCPYYVAAYLAACASPHERVGEPLHYVEICLGEALLAAPPVCWDMRSALGLCNS
jgi:hypothetical protein